ncbi:MAG: DUF721 domain-containing protein [bacterium]|nr:DUF721 domain-containing protein [bacterium]
MKEKKFSEVLPDAIRSIGCSDIYPRVDGILDWEKIWAEISGEASRFSYFLNFKDGIVLVAVKNSAWVLELTKRKPSILKALRDRTGKKIKEIKFIR